MEIIFSANNGEDVAILPIIPENMPEMTSTYKNTVFEGINGQINLIGNKELRQVTIESFFPVNKGYSFASQGSSEDGWMYVAFFNKWSEKKTPIRMIWLNKDREISNMAYTIESFTTSIQRNLDIKYTLELKEYKFVKIEKI